MSEEDEEGSCQNINFIKRATKHLVANMGCTKNFMLLR